MSTRYRPSNTLTWSSTLVTSGSSAVRICARAHDSMGLSARGSASSSARRAAWSPRIRPSWSIVSSARARVIPGMARMWSNATIPSMTP
ncbi:hypothetical protein QP028_14110 [Corynebacterium suedekumii]|nr:hypothetical protein QP028_14110 [Corynebacterium suedekumii]